MLLQKGRFLINNILELENVPENKDGIRRTIDLAYMGKFEYEGNTIPISRMFMEYYKDKYLFYQTNVINRNGEIMYIYANSDIVNKKLSNNNNFINDLAQYNIEKNFSLWEYVNHEPSACLYNFWWNVESDYLIIFGEEKKEIVNKFINDCYYRDGGNDEIKRKLLKVGYNLTYKN